MTSKIVQSFLLHQILFVMLGHCFEFHANIIFVYGLCQVLNLSDLEKKKVCPGFDQYLGTGLKK